MRLEAVNRELEAFSYSVSHDLRAPLRAISGFSQAVVEDYGPRLDDEGRRYLGLIQKSAHKMGQLIDDLLTFSRLSRREMTAEQIDMTALARTVFAEMAELAPERRIEFRAERVPPCRGDRAMLHQVLANLIGNAIKFTEPREEAVIEFGWREEDGAYYVKDNGVGFEMQVRRQALRRVPAPARGDGVRGHGRRPGAGAPHHLAPRRRGAGGGRGRPRRCILFHAARGMSDMANGEVEVVIIEDDPNDAELITRVLRKHHLANKLVLLKDGAEALDFLLGVGSPGPGAPQPRVVLLDLKLPKVDGIEVLRRLKGDERTRNIPVVVLTSSKEDYDLKATYELGVNSYITKPVKFEEFAEVVSELRLYWLLMNQVPRQ